ncbi:MAG: hypothetical protein BWK79_19760 [Beggiatoa sp. IS2]|nr:MAG: hypothetical protein BWK79_19760 [Beggiatoa sp. IS2]
MKRQISKHFIKDVQRISDQRILIKIRQILEKTALIEKITDIPHLEEIAGYPNYYRIKFDYNYRIGIYCDGETVEFLRVGTRGDFYKKFPK